MANIKVDEDLFTDIVRYFQSLTPQDDNELYMSIRGRLVEKVIKIEQHRHYLDSKGVTTYDRATQKAT